MPWPATLALALVGLLALDRLLRWMEGRGWIYYRLRRPSGSGALDALAEFQAMLQPNARQVVIARDEGRDERDDDGGPDGEPKRPRPERRARRLRGPVTAPARTSPARPRRARPGRRRRHTGD